MMPDVEAHDIRFGYQVIADLAASVRQMTTAMADIQKTQVGMLERLARIEANRVNEDVARLDVRFEAIWNKVDTLEQDRDRRDGASRFTRGIITWWPAIGILLTVLFLLFRATGIVHLPSDSSPVIAPHGVP